MFKRCVEGDLGYDTLCHVWEGAHTPHGYGVVWRDGRVKRAHRVAYEDAKGPIPDGLVIDHLCRVPACCNPEHLEAVTHAENCRRGVCGEVNSARYAAQTHCVNGHERTPENIWLGRRKDNGALIRACRACARERRSARRRESLELVTNA